jgi:hypothetical protein
LQACLDDLLRGCPSTISQASTRPSPALDIVSGFDYRLGLKHPQLDHPRLRANMTRRMVYGIGLWVFLAGTTTLPSTSPLRSEAQLTRPHSRRPNLHLHGPPRLDLLHQSRLHLPQPLTPKQTHPRILWPPPSLFISHLWLHAFPCISGLPW